MSACAMVGEGLQPDGTIGHSHGKELYAFATFFASCAVFIAGLYRAMTKHIKKP